MLALLFFKRAYLGSGHAIQTSEGRNTALCVKHSTEVVQWVASGIGTKLAQTNRIFVAEHAVYQTCSWSELITNKMVSHLP